MEREHGREGDDGKSYCYRIEERKILPGIPIGKDQYGKMTYYSDLYIIVEGTTEKYIDASGNKHKKTSNLFATDYFKNGSDAKNIAVQMHLKRGCNSPKCEWTKVVKEEKIKMTPQQIKIYNILKGFKP